MLHEAGPGAGAGGEEGLQGEELALPKAAGARGGGWGRRWLRVLLEDGPADGDLNWAGQAWQVVVAGALTALVGGVLQLSKLADVDSAGRQFEQSSYASKVSFLVPFAFSKALANFVVGFLADWPSLGRKKTEIIGWSVGLLVPVLLLSVPSQKEFWPMAVAANVFLGLQQGFCWSVLIIVFIDLFGPRHKGLASGANETIGYTAVALFALVYEVLERVSVRCAWREGPRSAACAASLAGCQGPDDWAQACTGECVCEGYYSRGSWIVGTMGIMCLCGLLGSILFLRETLDTVLRGKYIVEHSIVEMAVVEADEPDPAEDAALAPSSSTVLLAPDAEDAKLTLLEGAAHWFGRTTWGNRSTLLMCAAGFVANLTTGLAWGLILVWARDVLELDAAQRNTVTACYSFIKGLSQVGTGALSDRVGRRLPVAAGLAVTGAALLVCGIGTAAVEAGGGGRHAIYVLLVLTGCIHGVGTGLMYPVLAAAVADHAPVEARAVCIGTFRFWRDLGYGAGALVAALASVSGPSLAISAIGVLCALLGLLVFLMYKEAR